jgi:tetratricopeptide (TPR) repeat protein
VLTRRYFQVLVALAALCMFPTTPIIAAHGGGGGGGGGHGGGGGGSFGGGHGGGSFSGGAAHAGGYSGGYTASRASYAGSSGAQAYHGQSYNAQAYHGQSSNGQWNHHSGNGDWGHDHGDWGHDHGYWGHGYGGYGGWGWGWGFGWGFPFDFGYWGGYPYGWGGYWGDYFCPYGPVYSAAYPMADYGYSYPDAGQYAANYPSAPTVNQAPPVNDLQVGRDDASGNEGLQYYSEARGAFAQGDYRNALRLAGHAAVEAPQNSKVHEMTSLALFASGEYRGAATAAHAALALGAPSDWANLYSYYNDAEKYTEQLRKLEKTVTDAPTGAAGHFLLGYHYLMTGAKQEALKHFTEAAKLTPNDKLAQHIVKQLQANGTVTPPVLPGPGMPAEPKGKQL